VVGISLEIWSSEKDLAEETWSEVSLGSSGMAMVIVRESTIFIARGRNSFELLTSVAKSNEQNNTSCSTNRGKEKENYIGQESQTRTFSKLTGNV